LIWSSVIAPFTEKKHVDGFAHVGVCAKEPMEDRAGVGVSL
jgi:hypothetical protein